MKWMIALVVATVLAAAGYWHWHKQPSSGETATAATGKPVTVRFGTEGAYPPFNYIDETGNLKGFDIDIAKALCSKAGLDCTFVAQDWDGLIPGLQANRFDAIIASMSITPERQEAVAFTNRYYRTPIRFVSRKEKPLSITEEGLRGKRIGVQRATTSAIYLEEKYKGVVDIKTYDTQENVHLDLLAGRLDGMLADAILVYDWMDSAEGKNYEFRGETYFVDDGIGIALRKEDKALVEKLNKAIAIILEDGTYEAINKQYFPFSIY
jgi:putative lysine/arginine/ornithine/histidine/octopine transport system substrate-binding protein